MRIIDATGMDVVSMGLPWRHALSPCSKQAIALLERNTKVVTWLAPKGGKAQDHLPCIFYKDKYFSLSLRMQKAIYRHIRLKKGFKNEEMVNGFTKLRIPDLLLKEKIRTQSRFDAMRNNQNNNTTTTTTTATNNKKKRRGTTTTAIIAEEEEEEEPALVAAAAAPAATTTTASSSALVSMMLMERRDRSKSVSTVAWRMKEVVHRMIDNARGKVPHQHLTIFLYRNQQCEITNAFFQELEKENTALFGQRADFMQYMLARYDEFARRNAVVVTPAADPQT